MQNPRRASAESNRLLIENVSQHKQVEQPNGIISRQMRLGKVGVVKEQHQAALTSAGQRASASVLTFLFQLLTCRGGISQRRLKHTQTARSARTGSDADVRFVFSH